MARTTHGTLQKHVEHQDATDIQKITIFINPRERRRTSDISDKIA